VKEWLNGEKTYSEKQEEAAVAIARFNQNHFIDSLISHLEEVIRELTSPQDIN